MAWSWGGAGSGAVAGTAAGGPFGGLAGGVLGGLFGGGDDEGGGGGQMLEFLDLRNPDQKRVQAALADWITKYMGDFKPGEAYTGKMTAPMSGFETQGLQSLQRFMDQPDFTNLLSNAGNEVNKTLTGKYDPYTSDFYKAARDAAMIERGDARNRMNAELGSRGKYFSSEALREGKDMDTRTTNFLQQTLASLAENERQNRLKVLPYAESINKEMVDAPLKKVAASQTYGALPRTIEQADYERLYQDFLRKRQEQALPISAAAGFNTQSQMRTYANNTVPAEQFDPWGFLGDQAQNIDWTKVAQAISSAF